MRKFFNILSLWLPVAVYLGLIYYFSSLSKVNFNWTATGFPLHVIEYCILSILIIRAVNSGFRKKVRFSVILLSFSLALTYAVLDEIHQAFVPNRTSSLFDIMADAIGALLGITAVAVFQKVVLRRDLKRK